MKTIATVTLNPAIDGACDADHVVPIRKTRTFNQRYDPGGGGINVARTIRCLGGDALAVYCAGGATGSVLDALLAEAGLRCLRIAIADHTRISLAVLDRATGGEYRFVPEGPCIADAELDRAMATIGKLDCDYLVLSGSLPRCAPDDSYVRIAATAHARGARVIIDSSGPELKAAINAGGLFLAKPSRGEFEALVGRPLADIAAIEVALETFMAQGLVENMVVTLGHDGALLANRDGIVRLAGLPVTAVSAVGAGDSFVGAMAFALADGRSVREAFRLGLAAGTAAVLRTGTGLCDPDAIARLFRLVPAIPD